MITGKILNPLFIKIDKPSKVSLKNPYHSPKIVPSNTFNYLLHNSMTAEEKILERFKYMSSILNKMHKCSVSSSFLKRTKLPKQE